MIRLRKRVPVAAGLGGGSSDAAAVLHGLNILHEHPLSSDALAELGLALGADVPFFLLSGSAAIARGVGEILEPVLGLSGEKILLVNPGFPVSTKWVYENLALTSEGNTFILAPESAALTYGNSGPGEPDTNVAPVFDLGNDLESVTMGRYPEVGRIKKAMVELGAMKALMSGSGPTVFGLFQGETEAQNAFGYFRSIFPQSVFLTEPWEA